MSEKIALITGITGQDGAYLAELLLHRGYRVHGLRRRSSSHDTARIDHLLTMAGNADRDLVLHDGNMTDSAALTRVVQQVRPREIYNLAAQSDVHLSFDSPEYTVNANAAGALRLLEAVRTLGLSGQTRFYQASTSEMFGDAAEWPQRETTPFRPRNPYGVAKLYAYWITVNYRQAYGVHASNGILFNHESPRRGEAFVSRKISRAVAATAAGRHEVLCLGNLEAQRDWGHARDYVEAMRLMLQQPVPDDYVIATGECHSVREFAERAFRRIGVAIEWRGSALDEVGVDRASGRVHIRVDARLFRPTEVNRLQGDAAKARRVLGWSHRVGFEALVDEMVDADLQTAGVEGVSPLDAV
jgi:GDPmannose 4,6-dehydratase